MAGLPIQLLGRSGHNYPFQLYPWGQAFRGIGGIYAVMREKNPFVQAVYPLSNDVGPGYSVQYLGQTGDLSQRPEHHHRQDDFQRVGATHIAVMTESSKLKRLAIESDLVSGMQPPLNETNHG